MNFWMDSMREELDRTISMVDVLCINEEEAAQLTGKKSLLEASKAVLEMGPRYVIIKKGGNGAMLFSKDEMFYAPAMLLDNVCDPTGAGDTFAGGFMGYIAKQDKTDFDTMKSAVIAGSALASYCVQDFGTQNLQNLTQDMINKRVDQFINLVKFDYKK